MVPAQAQTYTVLFDFLVGGPGPERPGGPIPQGRDYQVSYVESGRLRCRVFSWAGDSEPEAYRGAIEFRKWTISRGVPTIARLSRASRIEAYPGEVRKRGTA